MNNKSSKNNMNLLLALGAIAGAATLAVINKKKSKSKAVIDLSKCLINEDRQV